MNEFYTLRGIVLSKYKTIGEFAKAMNWQRNKAARLLNGAQELTANEIVQITERLELPQEIFLNIFFNGLSTLWTERHMGTS